VSFLLNSASNLYLPRAKIAFMADNREPAIKKLPRFFYLVKCGVNIG